EEKVNHDEQFQIKNHFSYVIGVKLSETTNTVSPHLQLNKVKANLVNYRPVVTANLQNTKPVIVNNLDIHAQVKKEGEQGVLHETKKKNLSMAPNSNFDFSIGWEHQRLEPGNYHLYITATNGDQTWKFDKPFQIHKKEATSINDKAV